ncbi:MAG: helix-turn-helix domain-containing protein [Clostridia bacterium]|nr:helix-turn-helix domain-containing protein [Clostridia bacterium]
MSVIAASHHPSFGAVLKQYRTNSGFTKTDVAEAIGVTRNTYYNWELDRNKPSFDQIILLSNKLEIPISELFGVPSTLSEDEANLLKVYRSLSPRGKILCTRMANQIQLTENEESKTIESFQSGLFEELGSSG